jgi:PAS domain S-box-containing protein
MSDPIPNDDQLRAELAALRRRVAELERAGNETADDLLGVGPAAAHSFVSQLLRHAPAPIYLTTAEGRFLFVNPASEAVLKVSRERVIGRAADQVLPAATARRLVEVNEQVLASQAPLTLDEYAAVADGLRCFHTVAFPVRDASEALLGVGGISFDVTDRQWAAEAARAAEARSRELLEASPDGITVVSDLTLTYVNPAFCALLGYDRPEDLIGKPETFVLTDACKDCMVRNTLRRAEGLPAPERYEVEYRHRDGHAVPAEVHVRLIDVDGVPSSLAHVRDMTERKKAENALRESEGRLRYFFDATFEGIVLHENGIILDLNQRAVAVLGYETPEEVVGHHVLEFSPASVHDLVRARIAAGSEEPYETVGLRRDGSTFPCEVRGKNVPYRGRTVRVTAIRDLSLRKAAEEQVRDYAARLQALSRRLLAVQEEERQHLARELHDEIGQALTGLQYTLELAERQGEAELRRGVREARGLVRDLTAQVRDLSLRLRPTMLDDLGLLPALTWHCERFTAQTGVRVALEHHGLDRRFHPEAEVTAYRVVQEALTNVARHAGVGEAAVRICLDGGLLHLEIEDRGAGFDPEAVLASGAGCGLSGLRQRVTLLGGRFDVRSAPGAGTRLTAEWRLPLTQESGVRSQWPASAPY